MSNKFPYNGCYLKDNQTGEKFKVLTCGTSMDNNSIYIVLKSKTFGRVVVLTYDEFIQKNFEHSSKQSF